MLTSKFVSTIAFVTLFAAISGTAYLTKNAQAAPASTSHKKPGSFLLSLKDWTLIAKAE